MVTIYVWNPDAEIGSIGHVSLKVDNSSTYISWYPLDNKNKLRQWVTTKEQLPSSYDEDCSHYTKRPADRIFKIQRDIVSASKIDDWWSHNRPGGPYHLLARNCATVVRDVLVFGSRHLGHILLLLLLSWKWSVTPMDIKAFCILIQKKYLDIVNILLGALFLIGLAIVVFIKLFYGSQTFSQAILLCLRTILIISSLLKYVELSLALCSMPVIVLTYHFMVYMIQMIVNYFNDFNDTSYTDPGISLIDPNEYKRFTLWVISILVCILVSTLFKLSPLKAGFIFFNFFGTTVCIAIDFIRYL